MIQQPASTGLDQLVDRIESAHVVRVGDVARGPLGREVEQLVQLAVQDVAAVQATWPPAPP